MSKTIKIAIVDDEQDTLDMIEKFLKRSDGFEVVTFINPMTALFSIDESYDLILLDIMMPQMNGLEVLKELRVNLPDIKIIMMTAYSTLDKVLQSHREGASHYIVKPFSSMKALQEKIQELVS